MNFSLTPDQLALQTRAREFALKEVLPVSRHYEETDEVPLFFLEKAFEAVLMNRDTLNNMADAVPDVRVYPLRLGTPRSLSLFFLTPRDLQLGYTG